MIKPNEPTTNETPSPNSALGHRSPLEPEPAVRHSSAPLLILVGIPLLLVLLISPLVSPGRAREAAQRIKCMSNLKQIDQWLRTYSQTNDGVLPSAFDELIASGDLTSECFVCPSSDDVRALGPTTQAVVHDFRKPGHNSYVYALSAGTLVSRLSAQHVVAHDLPNNHPEKDGQPRGMNVLYGDGTVVFVNMLEGQRVISELQAGFNPPRPVATQPTGR